MEEVVNLLISIHPLILPVFLAGLVNGFKDKSSMDYLPGVWWNKGKSWLNKWDWWGPKVRHRQYSKLWYYLWVFTPKYRERFPYSTTILVWVTDGWHLLQFLQFNFIFISLAFALIIKSNITIPEAVISALFLKTIFSLGFHTSYNFIVPRILKRNN